MRSFAWLALAVLAGVVTHHTAAYLLRTVSPSSGEARAGISVIIGCAVAAAAMKVYDIGFTNDWTRRTSSTASEFVYVAAVFTMLGVFGDTMRPQPTRARHRTTSERSLRSAIASPALLLGGAALGLLALSPESELEWAAVEVCMLLLAANFFGLLAHRQGRACAVFLPAAFVLLIPGATVAPGVGIGLGAVAAFMRLELTGRARLSSGAAVGMGAFLGWGVILRGSHVPSLSMLVALIAAHALAWRPGLDRLLPFGAVRDHPDTDA